MEETRTTPQDPHQDATAAEPPVSHTVEGETARITVGGELTEAARRPLVRTVTDLLLTEHSLRRVELDLREVPFMNSAGLAVLVQLQKLGVPRAIDTALVDPPPSVARPLQLSGLWHRFTVVDAGGAVSAQATSEGGPGSRGTDHS